MTVEMTPDPTTLYTRLFTLEHEFIAGLFTRRLTPPHPRATLFYIHGLGESGFSFEKVMAHPRLAAFAHVAVDLPNYGKSPWVKPPLDLEAQAERLAAWLAATHSPPVVVMGHSMGGVIGQQLCAIAPQHVAALINIEGNISAEDCLYSAMVASIVEAEWLAGGYELIWEELYRMASDDPALRTYYPSVRLADARAYYRNSHDLVCISEQEVLASRMAALACPTLFLLGHPRGTTKDYSRQLLTRAGVTWRAIDNAGHWPYLDQPEAFIDEVLAFLESLSAGSAP